MREQAGCGNSGDDQRPDTLQNDEKPPSQPHCLSSKENEDNTGQAMAINDARSPSVESKVGQRWKHRWKHQRHANGRNTATSPPACALADRKMPVRLRVVVSKRGSEQAACGNNSGNSGDDPMVDASRNDEMSSLNPIGSHPRKTKMTPIKQWPSTSHAPSGGEQGGTAVETSVKTSATRQW